MIPVTPSCLSPPPSSHGIICCACAHWWHESSVASLALARQGGGGCNMLSQVDSQRSCTAMRFEPPEPHPKSNLKNTAYYIVGNLAYDMKPRLPRTYDVQDKTYNIKCDCQHTMSCATMYNIDCQCLYDILRLTYDIQLEVVAHDIVRSPHTTSYVEIVRGNCPACYKPKKWFWIHRSTTTPSNS